MRRGLFFSASAERVSVVRCVFLLPMLENTCRSFCSTHTYPELVIVNNVLRFRSWTRLQEGEEAEADELEGIFDEFSEGPAASSDLMLSS